MAALPKSGVQLVAESAAQFFSDMEKAGTAVTAFGRTTESAGKGVSAFGTVAAGALMRVGEIAVNVAGQAAAALGAFVSDSVSAAGDFEANMNTFGAVAGDALTQSGQSLEDFKQLFISLGTELPVSTAEVQQAAIELAKGGLDPATIAAGGLRTALDLAAAGGVGLADSAGIMAKQLGVWVDSTADAATKAAFLAETADLLSQSANATTSDVGELALGLANAGGTAKVAGLDFRETVTGLSLLAPGFSSASDAGTSFKTFLSRLIPTTKPATAAMIDLGLATDEGKSKFYDAQGSFVGLKTAAEMLQYATRNLSEEQKLQAFQTIFGADAIRAASILSEQGAEGYDRMTASLAAAGTVQEQAAARQQGFNTALDNAKGSFEALQLTIGTALLPILSTLLNQYIAPGINFLTQFASAVFGNAEAFAALSPAAQGVVGVFQAVGQAVAGAFAFFSEGKLDDLYAGLTTLFGGAIAGLIVDFAASVKEMIPPFVAFVTSGENLMPILGGIGAVIAAVAIPAIGGLIAAAAPVIGTFALIAGAGALLVAAWQADFGGIQGIVAGAFSGIVSAVQGVKAAFTAFFSTPAMQEWGQTIQAGAQVVASYFSNQFPGDIQRGIGAVQGAFTAFAATPWGQTLQAGAQVTADYFSNQWPGDIQRGLGVAQSAFSAFVNSPEMQQWGAEIQAGASVVASYFANQFPGDFQRGFALVSSSLATWVADIQRGAVVVATTWATVSAALQKFVADFQRGLALVTTTVSQWAGDVQRGAALVQSAIAALIAGIQSAFTSFVGTASSIGRAIVDGIASGIRGGAGAIRDAAVGAATSALNSAKSALGISSPSRLAAILVGLPFSQGIGIGVTQGSPFAVAASTTTAQQMIMGAAGAATAGAPAIGTALVQGMLVGLDADLSTAENALGLATQGLVINTSGMLGADAQTIGASLMQGAAQGVTDNAPVLTSSITATMAENGTIIETHAQQSIGEPFSKGVAAGITAGAPAIEQAVDAFATDTTKNAHDLLSTGAVDLGQPFAEDIAAGITDSAPVIGEAAEALGQEGMDTMPAALEPAITESLKVVTDARPGFVGAGKDLIGGMTEGVQAAAGELARAAAQAAKEALDAAKSELGIASPSQEAADEVGVPFVAGIVEGIAGSLDTIKAMARHLSKQLTEDMEKVALEAAKAFKEVLQAELEADVGFSDVRLSNFRKLQDLGKGSGTGDAQQGIADAQKKLEEGAAKQADADADYEDTVAGLHADARKNEAARLAAIEKVNASTKTEAEKAAAIADINRDYDDKLGEINGKLMDARDAYEAQTRAITAEVAQLEQALALAKARLLIEQEMDEHRRANVAAAQRELDQAAKEAEAMRKTDPAAADAYYKLRSKQILDLADLEKDRIEALARFRASGSEEDRDRLQAIDTERALLQANQSAERALFSANAQANSPYAGLTDEITNLQNKLRAELERDQGFYNLTDKNNLKMREKVAREIAADQAALMQIADLLTQVGEAAIGGTTEGVEGGAPGLIAAFQAAMAEAQRAAEAQLGISSPSKVFAKDVGLPIMTGLAQGILKGQQAVNAAMRNAGTATLGQASALAPAAQAVYPAMSGQQIANSYSNDRTVNIGSFSAANGMGRAEVQAMIQQAMNRAGRTAYARQATR